MKPSYSKRFVEEMLRGYKLANECEKKKSVFLIGYPVAWNPTSREAFLLGKSDVTYKEPCQFHHRVIVNGNRIHPKTGSTLSKRVNHIVITQHESVRMVRSFVDVGSEVCYRPSDDNKMHNKRPRDRRHCLWDS